MKRKIKLRHLILIIVAVLFLAAVMYKLIQNHKYEKQSARAIEIAETYLSETYERDMQLIKATRRGVDAHPTWWQVFFLIKDYPEIEFVLWVNLGEDRVVRDLYYFEYYKYMMSDYTSPFIENIWGDKVIVSTYFDNRYDKRWNDLFDELGITENSPNEIVISFLNSSQGNSSYKYSIWIEFQTMDYLENDALREELSKKILDTFAVLKDNNFSPKAIIFYWYGKYKGRKASYTVRFDDWMTIDSIDEICIEKRLR